MPGAGGSEVGVGCTVDDGNTVDTGLGLIDPVLGGITLLLSTAVVMCEGVIVMFWGVTVPLNEAVTVKLPGLLVLLGEGKTEEDDNVTAILVEVTVMLGAGMEVFLSNECVTTELWTRLDAEVRLPVAPTNIQWQRTENLKKYIKNKYRKKDREKKERSN